MNNGLSRSLVRQMVSGSSLSLPKSLRRAMKSASFKHRRYMAAKWHSGNKGRYKGPKIRPVDDSTWNRLRVVDSAPPHPLYRW